MISQSRTQHQQIKKGGEFGLIEKAFALCLLGLMPTVHGAENEHDTEQSLELPDLEFLEFLGQFETDEGEWIEPSSLMADEFTVLLNAALVPEPNTDTTDVDDDDQPSNQ